MSQAVDVVVSAIVQIISLEPELLDKYFPSEEIHYKIG